MVTDRRLAEIALETRWVTLDKLKKIVPACKEKKKPLAVGFREMGLNDEQITYLQACALQLPFARPDRLRISTRAQNSIPLDLQQKYRVVPLRCDPGSDGETVYAAMLPEAAAELASHLSTHLGVTIIPVAASTRSIGAAIARNVSGSSDTGNNFVSAQDVDLDTPASPSKDSFDLTEGEKPLSSPKRKQAESVYTSLADF